MLIRSLYYSKMNFVCGCILPDFQGRAVMKWYLEVALLLNIRSHDFTNERPRVLYVASYPGIWPGYEAMLCVLTRHGSIFSVNACLLSVS